MKLLYLLLLLYTLPLFGIDIDLKEPQLLDGVLTTEEGGVISAPRARVQARKIRYTAKDNQSLLEAEKDIILEFGSHYFVGRKLVFDFNTNTGILYDGRTSTEQWYIGGQEIHLCSDGSYIIHDGFATTSENYKMDWRLETEKARLTHHKFLNAQNVKFRFIALPVFWIPRMNLNLDTIFDSPFRYTFKLGGTRGAKIGVLYTLYSDNNWKADVRLDYRLKSGFGGGFETHYRSPSKCTYFNTINYIAEDRTRYEGSKMTRYRLEGNYHTLLNREKTTVDLMWDKLSDRELATDYYDTDLRLEIAKPTQLEIRHKESNWIVALKTKIRANNFQTVKQELPTLSGSYRPVEVGFTGILSEGRFEASYLELEYTQGHPGEHDYNSPRYEISQTFWRPYRYGCLFITPEASGTAIYYGNNRNKKDRWMAIGLFDLSLHTDIYKYYGCTKHVLSPYIKYQYFTQPTTLPGGQNGHYVFDIDDGWYYLNAIRFGMTSNLYRKTGECCIFRKLYLDLFTYAFIDTDTIPSTIPKAYAKCVYNPTTTLRNTLSVAWDFDHNVLDHYNALVEWTISQDTAFSAEYRHRSPYDWRKVDRTNFILDSYRDSDELIDTALADQRDTILFKMYWRFHPTWALTFQSRNGWNRKIEPNYFEYQVALLGSYRSSWNVKMAYKHREGDDRFSINFSAGVQRPSNDYNRCHTPCLEF